MGILDPKSRIIDTILTNEGKRQLVNGQMRVEYISYSDSSINYLDEEIEKIILESNDLPQDQITGEADSNELIRKILTPNFKIINGNSFDIQSNQLSGSINDVFFDEIIDSSLQNYKKLQILESKDSFNNETDLISNINEYEIKLSTQEIKINNIAFESNINNMDSIFLDIDASKSMNYLYLPPIDDSNNEIFDYGFKKDTNNIINDDTLNKRLENKKKIKFNIKSSGNVHIQLFQSENNSIEKLKKLDIIKYGNLYDKNEYKGIAYFLGRLLVDQNGNSTFYRMFTVLLK